MKLEQANFIVFFEQLLLLEQANFLGFSGKLANFIDFSEKLLLESSSFLDLFEQLLALRLVHRLVDNNLIEVDNKLGHTSLGSKLKRIIPD